MPEIQIIIAAGTQVKNSSKSVTGFDWMEETQMEKC